MYRHIAYAQLYGSYTEIRIYETKTPRYFNFGVFVSKNMRNRGIN